jgi:uncharacterized phage-associated protein
MFNFFEKKVKIMEKGTFDARAVAAYIKNRYENMDGNIGKEISPIKIQKALYFCFAYWGAFVASGKRKKEQSEVDVSNYEDYLFDNKIEAWVYGPVVRDVYEVYKNNELNKYYIPQMFEDKNTMKDYLDGLLDEVLDVSDFRLVDISHNDNCWKKNFNSFGFRPNKEITKKDIINEYEKRRVC